MKTANRKSILALTLLASLTLPGLALADNWKHTSQHDRGGQHQQQGHNDFRNHNRGHQYGRNDRDGWHERYEHAYRYQRAPRVVYRTPVVYPAPPYTVYPSVYAGAYTGVPPAVYATGALITPSLGLVINLH